MDKIKTESLINELTTITNSGMNLKQYCATYSIPTQSWAAKKAWVTTALNKGEIDQDTANRFFVAYQNAQTGVNNVFSGTITSTNKQFTFEEDHNLSIDSTTKVENKEEVIENDERAETQIVRDSEGKVSYYKFKIFKRDKAPLMGKLTREEMNSVYRLYSYYGANITQREISRTLPEYSLIDFKRILRVFNITKACSPFAPHMYEEYTEEGLKEMHLRLKENDFIKKLEKDEINDLRKLNIKLAKELNNIKNNVIQNVIDAGLEIKESNFNQRNISSTVIGKKDLIIWLSDMHIGAYNDAYGVYDIDEYNYNDIQHRLECIIKKFAGNAYNNVYIVNLGDSIDSFKKETTRGGHPLPTIRNDKEISKMFISLMKQFFIDLQSNVNHDRMIYICIGESNHGGDPEWLNNRILEAHLQNMGIETYISDRAIDSFKVGVHTFTYAHGKNNYDQFKNFPLTLNEKTDLYFTQWMNENNITGKFKYVVKGDLHRFAYTVGNTFDYISVGSLYGSSNWITSNFGNTKWSINFMEIDGDNMQIGTIRE